MHPDQTPPTGADCGFFTATLKITSPAPASGPAGTHLTLIGSGFYGPGQAGYVQIWLTAAGSGTTLGTLASIPSGTSEPFTLSIDFPGVGTAGGLALGTYYLWGLNDTSPSNCADAEFNLTGVNPGLACDAWSSELSVTSPAPAVGVTGTPVVLQGAEFYDDNTTYVYWAAADGTSLTYLQSVASNSIGSFDLTVDVPTGFAPGVYFFWATDGTSDYLCAGAMFTLTAGPSLELTPSSGASGTTILVTGSGFSASDTSVTITGDVIQFPLLCTLSGGSITGSCSFQVYGGLAGPEAITGVGNVVGGPTDTATASFTLYPSIILSPSSGVLGMTITVSGFDFSADPAAADVSFDGELLTPTGGSDCGAGSSATLITPDSSGDFVCTFTVPPWATTGTNDVQADDTSTGELTAIESFTLDVGPNLELTPSSGASGDTITVTGSGFSASDTSINITGTVLQFTLSCSLSGGTITGSCTFPVYRGLAGPETITGVGNVVGGLADTGTATFTLDPTILLSSNSGPIGLLLTVSGFDFSASPAAADVSFDSELLSPVGGSDCSAGDRVTLITPDATGEFVCTFNVPPWAVSGENSVQGDDTSTGELTAAETFTETPPYVEEISSTSGTAGPITFTVGGLGSDVPYQVYLDSTQGTPSSATYNPIGSCTTSAAGVLSGCLATIPSGLASGTYYLDLYEDPSPPPFIFSVFHFAVAGSSSSKGFWNPLGLPTTEYEVVGGLAIVLIAIAVVLALVRRRRKPSPAPRRESPAAPARPPTGPG